MKLFGLFLITIGISWSIEIGSEAPKFAAKDTNGEIHRLADYKGKIVVLEWKNHGCPYVVKHYATDNMQALQRELVDKGVVWFSILSSAPGKQGHVSTEEANRIIADEKSAASAALMDVAGVIGRRYSAKKTPHMFVIDKVCNLAYQGAIDDNSSFFKSTVEGARNYVREAVSALISYETIAVPVTEAYGCSVKY